MYFNHEIKAMADRMFSEELMDTILAAYKQEMIDKDYDISEKDYLKGAEALSAALNEDQKATLAEMEQLCAENVNYALRFGFTRGVFTGFQQFFIEETTASPFEELICNELLIEPNMKKYRVYYYTRTKFNKLYYVLTGQLDTVLQDHLTSVYLAWDDRLHGVLRYSFYLGYRYALSVVNQLDPRSALPKIVGKILLTEHETGFTHTREELERFV